MKRACHRAVLLLVVCLSCSVPLLGQGRPATVREYKKVFPTYPYSDPNPIPTMGKIYPYFRYERYAERAVEKEWTVVELENDYIRVMILPEIGGKIWAAIEKSTGKPFIYYNHVVKFRDISMRGPWTSGGIEANYGIIGHTPNCATPVDYLTRTNADGSVSCFIGVLDLLTRTPWRLEVNLPADKAFFTTSSFWYNASPLEEPYYTWMNAGIKAAGNLQFVYPGTNYLGHGGEFASWPVNDQNGREISFYERNDFGGPKSYHVFGAYTEFFGGYWHDEEFGMARYAPHDEKPGKKIWIWGLSRQGMIWEKLLTDGDGQYVEVQSGRLFNQSAEESTYTPFKHRGFAPGATDRWTETWFPVKGTHGFVKANPYGALNVRMEVGELKIDFCPVQRIDDVLEVFAGEQLLYTRPLRLAPLQNFADAIRTQAPLAGIRVRLGGTKLEYAAAPGADSLNRPIESPKEFDWSSAYGLYLHGKEQIRQRRYADAQRDLEACLKKDPLFMPALTELAAIEYRNLHYDAALGYARRALAIDTYDPAANYYYALASLALGRVTDAKDGFDLASQSMEYRAASYGELGKIYFREGRLDRAAEYASKALDFNRYHLDAHALLAIVERRQGRKDKAAMVLDRILALDPLNHFARFERFLLTPTEERKRDFTSLIRNEMPHETYLELAIGYAGLGLTEDSLRVLALSPPHPEAAYWQAYLQRGDKAVAERELQRANSLSPRLVFPFRAETASVLAWAAAQSKDWRPKYYLALLDWSRGDIEAARGLLLACGSAPEYAPFYAARFAVTPAPILEDLERAAQLDPTEWRYGKLLAEYYSRPSVRRYDRALEIVSAYAARAPENYQLGALHAKSLLQNQRYGECAALLDRLRLLPFEGSTEGRQLHKEARLMLALEKMKAGAYAEALGFIADARQWPENLGAGKPYAADLDERLEDWLEAICDEQLQRAPQAAAALERIAAFQGRGHGVNTAVSALALQKLGQAAKAEELLAAWVAQAPGRRRTDSLAEWGRAIVQGGPPVEASAEDVNFRVLSAWDSMRRGK